MRYIKGGEYPEEEVGKYVYAIREGNPDKVYNMLGLNSHYLMM